MPLPYTKARLVIPKPSSKDQRWLIKYYVWSEDVKRKVMVRDTSCNTIKDLEERKKYCKKLIAEINQMLADGFHIDSKKLMQEAKAKLTNEQKDYMKVIDAVELGMKYKRSKKLKGIANYENTAKVFNQWLVESHLQHLSMHSFSHLHVEEFTSYLINQRNVGKRMHNNYLDNIKNIFKQLVSREIIEKNPCDKVEKLRAEKGRNTAFTAKQQKQLITYMEQNQPNMLNYCKVMYYTLMRTTEISNLQAWQIGHKDPNQIYVKAELHKNGMEKNITIPPQLELIIKQNKWRELPPDTYIFSTGFKPGKIPGKPKKQASRFRNAVLKKLNFTIDYTMYSWKHTGVVSLYRAGVPRYAIRLQAGFKDDRSFEAYLKSLGLFDADILVTNYPSLPV